jgi:hypothetical protein
VRKNKQLEYIMDCQAQLPLIDAGTYVVGPRPTLSVASNQGASGAGPGSRVGKRRKKIATESRFGAKEK